ncbi:MAG: hypothetical protein CL672_04980 [Balneola sp.]|nr:hypothetical protein [Balneola sp.]|tara:strand:- start:2247 stop:2765 length:519 start_codon:yes stop_codon:yes gene_type:complete
MITNKIQSNKKLIAIDIAKSFGSEFPLKSLDITPWLYKGLLLKEDLFREGINQHNWQEYQKSYLCIEINKDALIAPWAYMLLVEKGKRYARDIFFTNPLKAHVQLIKMNIDEADFSVYKEKYVLLKGCSNKSVTPEIYAYITKKLIGIAKKIMYGEACSFVPVYIGQAEKQT